MRNKTGKIRLIERKAELELAGLLPPKLTGTYTLLLGCEEQGQYMGAAALLEKGREYVLLWLFVDPKQRRKGYGGALLSASVALAKKQGAEKLSVVYEAGNESGPELDLLFAKQGFLLELERTARVRISREALRRSELMRGQQLPLRSGSCVVPLSHIGNRQLKALIGRCEKSGYRLVSEAEYGQADAKRSMTLISENNEIRGILLVQHEAEDGVLSIPLLYIEKEYIPDGMGLLEHAARAVMEPEAGFKSLEFCCMEEGVIRLTDRFVKEKKVLWEEIITGTMLFF